MFRQMLMISQSDLWYGVTVTIGWSPKMKPVKQVETSKVIFEHFQTLKMIYSTNLDGIYQRSSLLSGNVICFS
ncbi:hypothetical protein HanHA89_Chr04g0128021 [Helianthus annuus]|nr:hypothetical protein HanHA89_Chr04g0128021 [Helianthus annuus]